MEDKYQKYRENSSEYNLEDNACDLEPSKVCDNCGKCIESNENYKIIKITKIMQEEK